MVRYSAFVVSIALGTALAGCGSSSDKASDKTTPAGSTSSSAAASSPATAAGITIKDFQYTGQLTVKAGQKVSVKNDDATTHTLTEKGKLFDTGDIAAGGTRTFTAPTKPGTYSVYCLYHPTMLATVTVR